MIADRHDVPFEGLLRPLLVLLFLVIGSSATLARAELLRLEEAVATPAAEITPTLKGKKAVVCVRAGGRANLTWAAHEGLAVEMAAALRNAGVEAIPASADVRLEKLSTAPTPFTIADAKRAAVDDNEYLVAGNLEATKDVVLKLAIWRLNPPKLLGTKSYPLPPETLDLQANVPELNRKVVEHCQANFDKKVGAGQCSELASTALEAVGAKRPGVYAWGRELAPQEPVLPGDVLQMELVHIKGRGWSKTFKHHTAVVEQVLPSAVVVLQQNVGPKGQIVQRDTWPLDSLQSGYLVAYRPLEGETPLPPVSPKRRTPPTVVKSGKTIDLLRTIDPRLDAVKGIWFIEENTLRMNRDSYARLQVPVAPPEEYTLRMRVKRLVGNDQLGVGVIVGGRQTMCSFDAYGGTVSGLHLVDGRKVRDNPTTYRGQALPMQAPCEIVLRVTPTSLQADVDGKNLVDWKGDPQTLSVDPNYAVPTTQWLFLAAWNAHFAVSAFTLEEGLSTAP